MESLSQLLRRAIGEGVTLYNEGNHRACCEIYLSAARHAAAHCNGSGGSGQRSVVQALEEAIDDATSLIESKKQNYGEAAWVLRLAFDDILETEAAPSGNNSRPQKRNSVAFEDQYEEWQDSHAENSTDLERARNLENLYSILLSSVKNSSGEDDDDDDSSSCYPASKCLEVLTDLGLAKNRCAAAAILRKLVDASFVAPIQDGQEGSGMYRFPTKDELESRYDELLQQDRTEPHPSGSTNAVALLALREFLGAGNAGADPDEDPDDASLFVLPKCSKSLSAQGIMNEKHREDGGDGDPKLTATGIRLAVAMAQIEPCLALEDRHHHFKKYPNCFVGSDTVTKIVAKRIVPTRKQATALLQKFVRVGFIRHVTNEHDFEDKYLFYNVVPSKQLQDTVTYGIDRKKADNEYVTDDVVTKAAIVERLKQVPKLSVCEILNLFYGCASETAECSNGGMNTECWDAVDLQTWRNNMKRWGFGRREDQDDEMVDKLSPLALAVDPDEWRMEDQEEEWSTPWGILAQIAVFDQVPRSAFRGTADAFKWDALAIRATRYAIDRGYFDSAYSSTLNRFVVLLPLEHSESWEDQKLGVNLLLRMLSTVAIEEEGLSDYEIVKRLEFSKRLSTAFLEHAQVVAKFKRYPHRNNAHGRRTTLEERVWLASDLVPRWAKSQQHTDEESGGNLKRGTIRLPVIPLKKLTRGR